MTTRICLWITYSNYLGGIYYNNSPLITHTSAPSCWNSYANFLSIAPPNNLSPAFKLALCKIILSKITLIWYLIAIWECPHNKQFPMFNWFFGILSLNKNCEHGRSTQWNFGTHFQGIRQFGNNTQLLHYQFEMEANSGKSVCKQYVIHNLLLYLCFEFRIEYDCNYLFHDNPYRITKSW